MTTSALPTDAPRCAPLPGTPDSPHQRASAPVQNSTPPTSWLAKSLTDQNLIALLIFLALLCYGNSLLHSFVYDDEQQILQNPYVKSWHYLPQIFTSTVWSFVGAAGATNYYRPLMTFTFLILWQLFGDIPFGFHLFNITLNAAVVVMLFYAGRALFNDRRIAWIAAALFAIHPVHTEVVDWIAAVPELEVTFFVLLTFYLFMKLGPAAVSQNCASGSQSAERAAARFAHDATGAPQSGTLWKLYAASVAAFAAALLSKEPALMFAPLAIVYEFFVRPVSINENERRASATLANHSASPTLRTANPASAGFAKSPAQSATDAKTSIPTESLAAKAARCLPICVVAAAYLLLRIALFGKLAPVLQHPKVTWPQAISSAFALIAGYTKYLFWPAPLSAFHVFHASFSLTELPVLAGIGVVLITVALILYLYKQAPTAAFSIFWIGVTIAPMLNARWMAANVFTERYLYLPSAGFCWLIAWCAINLWDRTTQSAPRELAALANVAPVHGTPPAFASEGLAPPQGTLKAKNVAAQSAATRGQTKPHANRARPLLVATAAIISAVSVTAVIKRNAIWRDDLSLYTRTLETNPDAAVIRSNLGALYYDAEQFDRALQEWQIALAQKPDNVVTMNALGIVYTRLNRYSEADAMFHQAMAARPLWGDSHFNYALLLQKTGRLPEALPEFKTAVQLSPLSGPAHRWYGEALVQNHQLDEAATQFRQAVDLEASLESMQDLVDVYHRQGRDADSEPILRRMVKQFPYDSTAHLALARTLEVINKPAEALREYQKVLSTDSTNAEAKAAVPRLSH
jgi:Tfp pilus assembly protein PilF